MEGVWLDVSAPDFDYEVQFNPNTFAYRNRIRSLMLTTDPSVVVVRSVPCADWTDGKPPTSAA